MSTEIRIKLDRSFKTMADLVRFVGERLAKEFEDKYPRKLAGYEREVTLSWANELAVAYRVQYVRKDLSAAAA